MPMMSGSRCVAVQLERDHSPLPDVGTGLDDDFWPSKTVWHQGATAPQNGR